MSSPPAGAVYAVPAGADNNCVAGNINCTPAQLAGNDVFLSNAQAAGALPGGQIIIVFNNAPVPPTYQITVR